MANPGFEDGTDPWRFSAREQYNLRRTYRRTSFLLTRLLANMGARPTTPVLENLSNPPAGAAGPSLVRNADFTDDADGDGMPDDWVFSAGAGGGTCVRQPIDRASRDWAMALTCPTEGGEREPSVMLAQHDLPIEAGQWYRIALRAKAEGIGPDGVTMAIQNTTNWRALFDYQRFTPGGEWRRFDFLVQANDTAERTRLQIWYGGGGKLWLAGISVTPIMPPRGGRWLEGLYLDTPEEWDDPYRFFRW
jgi:hypothetical protein